MKHLLILCLVAFASRAQQFPNPLHLPDGRIVWNPSRELCLEHGSITTNTIAQSVVTNWPEDFATKRAVVTNYLTLVTEAGVLGLGEDGADAKLDADFKNGSQSQKNDALRISLKLLRAKLVLERLGVSPTNAAAALQPSIVTNPARVEIEWTPKQ